MKFNELVVLYFERTNAYWTLWGFYITFVIGALAGFVAAPDRISKKLLASIVTIGFMGFVWANLSALAEVLQTRNKIAEILWNFSSSPEKQWIVTNMRTTIHSEKLGALLVFHLCSDAAFIAGIWAVAYGKLPLIGKIR